MATHSNKSKTYRHPLNKMSPNKEAESITDRGTIHQSLYFPTRINHVDIPDYKNLNKQLVKDIYKWKKEGDGITRSNEARAGGWHSGVDMHKRPEKSFQHLYHVIQKSCVALIEKYILHTVPFSVQCDTMWANVNPTGGFNKSHTHPGAIFSGVYYVQAPDDCGKIILEDPVVSRQYCDIISAMRPSTVADTGDTKSHLDFLKLVRPEDYPRVNYNPIPGRLILFPSYLAHYVEPNLNKKDRISVSFNINVFRRIEQPQATNVPNKQYKFNPGFTKPREPKQFVQQNEKTQAIQPKIWKLPGT